MANEDPEKWISEFASVWKSSGFVGKLLMVFACIGASTTLTNLSGIIIEWKGLIAEMLYFYTQYVRNPIADLIHFITFGFVRPAGSLIDAILLYLIYFSAEKRVAGDLRRRSVLNSSLFVAFVIVLPLVVILVLLASLFFVDRYLVQGAWVHAGAVTISVPLFLIFWSLFQWIRSLIWLSRGNCPKWLVIEDPSVLYRREIREFIQFATPMVVAFLVLALLASINLGLRE